MIVIVHEAAESEVRRLLNALGINGVTVIAQDLPLNHAWARDILVIGDSWWRRLYASSVLDVSQTLSLFLRAGTGLSAP